LRALSSGASSATDLKGISEAATAQTSGRDFEHHLPRVSFTQDSLCGRYGVVDLEVTENSQLRETLFEDWRDDP
jgi:hypothetical protein